jgi:DNA-binding transcriptional LysR family regulator
MDLAACILNEVPDDIHGHQVGEDSYSCLLRANHPLLTNGGLDLDQYATADHISISGGGDKNRALDNALAALGRQRRVRITVPFFHSALAFCASSDGILTLPSHMAENLRQRHDLALLPLPFEVERVRYSLIWHQRQQHDAAHGFVRERFYQALEKSSFSKPASSHKQK